MTTVLLVEDDADIANALKIRLKSEGFSVDTAADAVTAATVARRCNPDVAVLDISMPGGDGFVVAERLRTQNKNLPFIFITANNRPEYRARAEAMGATGFFEKPYIAKDLVAAVASAA